MFIITFAMTQKIHNPVLFFICRGRVMYLYKVLLVEDSGDLAENVLDYFGRAGKDTLTIDCAYNGLEAESLFAGTKYDLILLDVMLPDTSGFDLITRFRMTDSCPVIFLTALGDEENVLRGYKLGGDDYIVKPFRLSELYAKCLAILKRTAVSKNSGSSFTSGSITLDPLRMEVKVNDVITPMPRKEYLCLKLLLENKGRVITRDEFLSKIWAWDFDGSERVVDTHIKRLRQKLKEAGSAIVTVNGGGYRID